MSEFVLHPSVAVAWWLSYAAYADEAAIVLDQLINGIATALTSPDVATQVLSRFEESERKYTATGLNPEPQLLSLGTIRARFSSLGGSIRQAVVHPSELALVWGFETRYGISGPDAALLWLAIREDIPLLVADYELYGKLSSVSEPFPEFRVILLPDY